MEHWEFQVVHSSAGSHRRAVKTDCYTSDVYFYNAEGEPTRRLRGPYYETMDVSDAPTWPGDDAAVGVGSGPWCHGYAYP